MKRIPWDIILALLAGIGLGLVYSWMISPTRVIDSIPSALRADFKDQYRSSIAAAYAATGNLPRARARLSLLGDADPIEALNAQAQRMLANGVSGQSSEQADQIAALASGLENRNETDGSAASASTPTPPKPSTVIPKTSSPIPSSTPPNDIILFTGTPPSMETQQPTLTLAPSTPRPTRTLIPTLGAPFSLIGQESVCDSNLPDGLLQVIVLNSNRRQMPGIEILITWEGGEESFFTGFKPELGNGYADYIMKTEITYTVQLRLGSDVAQGLTAPSCQTPNGDAFFGGIKLTFQQP